MDWFVENAPIGVTILSTGDSVATIQINTYSPYTGTGMVARVSDGVMTGQISFNIAASNPPVGGLELTIKAPWYGAAQSFVTYSLPYGQGTQCAANAATVGATQYACLGWTGSGSAPVSGTNNNTGLFVMTNDSLVAWSWGTNFWVEAGASNGTINLTSGWYPAHSPLNAIVSPAAYYTFKQWGGDVAASNRLINPLNVQLDQPLQLVGLCEALLAAQSTPYWWMAHYGVTNNFNTAETNDLDHDGMLTWQEYAADTDPTNAASRLAVTGVRFVGGMVQVDWQGGVGVRQYLQIRQRLDGTNEQWVSIFTNLPPTSTTTNIIDAGATNSMLFYRIKTER
jgi:hypothetical protein